LTLSVASVSSPGGVGAGPEYTFVPGLRSGDVAGRGWVRWHLVRGICFLVGGPGGGAGIGAAGAEARASGVGAKAVLFGAECGRLAGEVLDSLQECGAPHQCGKSVFAVGVWSNTR
jgi:hypothetical protein